MFFVLYKLYQIAKMNTILRKNKKRGKKNKEKELKNYLSNSPEMNLLTFSYASSSSN